MLLVFSKEEERHCITVQLRDFVILIKQKAHGLIAVANEWVYKNHAQLCTDLATSILGENTLCLTVLLLFCHVPTVDTLDRFITIYHIKLSRQATPTCIVVFHGRYLLQWSRCCFWVQVQTWAVRLCPTLVVKDMAKNLLTGISEVLCSICLTFIALLHLCPQQWYWMT